MNRGRLREVARVKGPGHSARQKCCEIGCGAKMMFAQHGNQLLILDLKIIHPPTSPPTVARKTPLLDLDQGNFERQSWMRKNASEIDQFLKQIPNLASLRTLPPLYDGTIFAFPLHERLFDDQRFDDADGVLFQQLGNFIADCRQRTVLDFDEFVADHCINPKTAEPDLGLGSVARVQRFQFAVE